MAIFKEIPEFDARILVDGKVAVEYDENDPKKLAKIPPRAVFKYIECNSDAYFAVQCEIDRKYKFEYESLQFKTYVDGMLCDTSLFMEYDYHHKNIVRGITHYDVKDYLQKFKFDFVSVGTTGTASMNICDDMH